MRWLLTNLALVLLLSMGAVGAAYWWLQRPMAMPAKGVELSIEPGTTAREVALAWIQAGLDVPPLALRAWFRFSGQARHIKAGSYALAPGATPRELLAKLVAGDEELESLRLIEGWRFSQWRAEMAKAPGLQASSAAMSDAELMAALGRPGLAPEGRFFPDTYRYGLGVTDLTVMRRAADAMDRRLAAAWQARAADLPISSPEQALVLASIVEKETGRAADRGQIAGVFINRLRINMPLQTDPTVIYGLGEAFDGNLRKRDLQTDGPFNTYLRRGLPPTPIAMPGAASLQAAVRPADTRALYFVARGDGSSVFSDDLAAHNRAVNQFQRRPAQSKPR